MRNLAIVFLCIVVSGCASIGNKSRAKEELEPIDYTIYDDFSMTDQDAAVGDIEK